MEFERRGAVGDTSRQRLFVFLELLEAHIGRLDTDVVLLEVFENLVIPAPVVVEVFDIFLVARVPCRENLLLLENVVFLLLRHGLGLRCAWEKDVAEDAERGERDAEAGVDALVRQIAVQENQQHDEDGCEEIEDHRGSFL